MVFRPSIISTLVLLALASGFAGLGAWQLERKAEKQDLFDRFRDAPSLGIEEALSQGARFAHVEAHGYYDPERHVLLDNRIFNGRAGVHVLTPFNLADGRTILVNRGWLPMRPDRRSLPVVDTPGGPLSISGILNQPPAEGPQLGPDDVLVNDRWPQLVTYFDLGAVNAALGIELEPWLLQLDPTDGSGFEGREWRAAVMGPEVHASYAVQWFALCAAALIIWIVLGARRAQSGNNKGRRKPG